MIGRRFISFLRRNSSPSSGSSSAEKEAKPKTWGRRIVSGGLICVTGGVALSALDDLVIYHGCSSFLPYTINYCPRCNYSCLISSKAMEKASKNQAVIEAIGEPIARGPWYNASLAVTHKRHSVSCTFPVTGPQGSGIFQLRAVRNEEENWLSFFRPRDWEILIMEALLHVPENEEKNRTFRISIADELSPLSSSSSSSCTTCVTGCPRTQDPDASGEKHPQPT
ncbi:hypothetical protein LXL04_036821 [Taraxacum kok-saghyz]